MSNGEDLKKENRRFGKRRRESLGMKSNKGRKGREVETIKQTKKDDEGLTTNRSQQASYRAGHGHGPKSKKNFSTKLRSCLKLLSISFVYFFFSRNWEKNNSGAQKIQRTRIKKRVSVITSATS